MVNTQIIANELNNKLNTIANAMNLGHQFRLMAHIGKAKQGNAIDGILKPVNSDALSKGGTDTGTVNSQIVYVAEVIVPTAIDNKSVLAVENAITKLVHDYNGYSFVNGSDNIIWELSMGTPKDYAMRGGTGLSMPMAFTVKVSYSDVGLINGIKAWTLDGETIPYTGEGVILDKEGVTLSVLEAKTQQTIPTSQRKQYKFTIPYDKTNVVCTTLQNDILNGDFRKTYTLAYNDGVVTYSAKVSLYKTGDMGTQKTGDATMMSVSFVDAGNKTYKDVNNNDVTYTIGLLSFPFDDQSENTLYFESQAAQQTYMNNAVSTGSASYRDMTAPNLNTTILTNVVYDASQGVQTYDVNTLTNLNYAAIKKTTTIVTPASGSTPATTTTQNQYYYYWVTQCTQGADGILLLDLKLDTIQTYMFNPNLTIPDCLIERAHLNRWIDNGDGTVSFDGTPTSKLFTREDIQNAPLRLTGRERLSFKYGSTYGEASNWLNEYVAGWLYLFMPAQQYESGADAAKYAFYEETASGNSYSLAYDTAFQLKAVEYELFDGDADNTAQSAFGVFFAPVFKKEASIILDGKSHNIRLSQQCLTSIMGKGAAFVYKFSSAPPIELKNVDWDNYVTISDNVMHINYDANNNDEGFGGGIFRGVGYNLNQTTTSPEWSGTGVGYIGSNRFYPIFSAQTTYKLSDYYSKSPITFGKNDKTYNLIWSGTLYKNARSSQTTNIGRPSEGIEKLAIQFFTIDSQNPIKLEFLNTVGTTYHYSPPRGLGECNITVYETYIEVECKVNGLTSNSPAWGTYNLFMVVPAIINAEKKPLFNPKLLGADYRSLRLTNAIGDGYDYDLQKINKQTIKTIYTSPISPDINRAYFRITDLDGVYNNASDQNLQGSVESVESSLPIATDAYRTMLANNKNFFAIQNIQNNMAQRAIDYNSISGGVSLLGGALQSVVGGGFGAAMGVGTAASAVQQVLSIQQQRESLEATKAIQSLTIDNMISRPNSVSNANGNVIFNLSYTTSMPIVEEYDMLYADKEKVNNHMFQYGFAAHFLDDVKNFLHTRKYFDYVQAQITEIQGIALSNEIRNDIKQHFARGIRFWNYTTFATNGVQYDLENYELWLED